MKEKIGKLLELLNEYENRDDDQQIEWRIGEGDKGEKGKVRGIVNEVYMGWVSELVVCSAYYGFIKWLVENDKIDVHSIPKFYPVSDHCLECVYEGIADNTIMLLSIQKKPIDFLISILK